MTDAAQQTFQHRIADLLDDVTEITAATSVAPAPAEVAAVIPPLQPPPAGSHAAQAATQVAATQMSPLGTAAGQTAPARATDATPEPVPPPAVAPQPLAEEIPSLPPFLAQTAGATQSAATAEGRSLPGTSLFVNSALRAAAKTEPPPQPPAATALTSSNGQSTLPLLSPSEPTATMETAVSTTAPEQTATATAAASVPNISIRGRSDGLVVEIGKGSWSEILATLDDRLQQSASFFRNARVAIDLGARATTEAELAPLLGLLKTHGMTPGAVRTSNERTFQAALAMGQTATLESAEGAAVADAATAATNAAAGAYFVYRGYLRSGHRLQRKESVLVIGDVNPGAEVNSEGDVLVWGRLRGVVHAGSGGNVRAIVAALDLEPTQLRIAHVVILGPDPRPGQPGKWFWRRSANKRPEIARIVNEEIALEEWDTGRPGGLVSLRRGG